QAERPLQPLPRDLFLRCRGDEQRRFVPLGETRDRGGGARRVRADSAHSAACERDVYGPTTPATRSRVASFSNAAIAFSVLPVSSSLARSTSMPCLRTYSTASAPPLVRFSPIGASAPVMELMKPILILAPNAGTARSSAI